MNLLQFVCVKLTIFLSIGIIIGYYWEPNASVGLSIVLILMLLTGWLWTKTKSQSSLFGCSVMMLSTALGVFLVAFQLDFTYRRQLSKNEFMKYHLWKLEIREELKETAYNRRYVVQVLSVDGHASGGKLLAKYSLRNETMDLSIDDQIWVWAKVSELKNPQNPHQFNYKEYLRKLGMHHQLTLDAKDILKSSKSNLSAAAMAESIHQYIESIVGVQGFGSEEWSVIKALLLGQRDDISDTLYEQYKNAGAIHILAVSGLHVGILLLIIQQLLKPLNILPGSRLIKMFTTAILLWAYALLAGFSASVIRAVTMFSFLAYAHYLSRPGISFNIMALSMSFILIFIDPLMLFQPGFQLSYAAVFSIIWLYPKLQRLWSPSNWFSLKVWQLSSVSLAAQAGILPISLYYFHQFPVLFLVSNLLIVPFLGIILGIGILTIILALLNCLPDLLVHFYNAVIRSMNATIGWVSGHDLSLENIYFDEGHFLLLTALMISLFLVLDQPNAKRIYIVFGFLLCIQIWDAYTSVKTLKKEQLTISHKYGNSILIYQSQGQARVLSHQKPEDDYLLESIKTGERLSHINFDTLANAY